MPTPATPFSLPLTSQAGIIEFSRQCYTMLNIQWNTREQMRQADLAYMREKDQTAVHKKSQLANKYGDSNKYQNITIPVVLPVVEAAVVYQSSVFLSGDPIFGVVAGPEMQDAALQMEALMENHSIRGGWIRQFQLFFRDGFKYNLSAMEVAWKRQVTATLESDPLFAGGKQGKPKEVIWEGNCCTRLDPYNMFWDSRVPITDIPAHGEFFGWTELKSRTALKMLFATLPDKILENVVPAFESGLGGSGGGSSALASYYIPTVNPEALVNLNIRSGTDWMAWAGAAQSENKIGYKNIYEVTTLYGRIIPADFKLRVPSPNTPQVWKFIIVNHSVVVYAERQTNAHGLIPVLMGQPLEDGLSYQTKSLLNNVTPIQDVSSAMMNSIIAARRRAISDRGLYDPSRVGEAQINSDNPSAKIPVRPAAYGKPLSESYFPIPFRDDQSSIILQEMGTIIKLSELVSGQNPARQGQFVKGNKTQTEFSDVMNNSNGRDQNVSLLLEAQVMTPVKEILKLNILQYQGASSVYYRSKKQTVKIDPIKLREAVIEFKITDGLTPASKIINADAFQTSLQVIGSSPQIAGEYNIGSLFSYLMKTQGADLKDFEKSKEQVAYEQASQQWFTLAQLAVSKGQEFKAPQPTPEQFNYLVPGAQPAEKPNALTQFIETIHTVAPAAQEQQPTDIGSVVPGTQ